MLDFGYYNMDCMDGMREFPDKYFDLAIVDPPYGISITGMHMGRRKNGGRDKSKRWDDSPPSEDYFKELFRVSKNQVIWGGNYFNLPPTRCFLIWDKGESMYGRSFSECEFAWTSLDKRAKIKKVYPKQPNRIHPTQKPIEIYDWVIQECAKPGDKILDTHVGSASSLISCEKSRLKYVGFEIDQDYYRESKKRLDAYRSQINLFDYLEEEEEYTQEEIFAYTD